MGFSHPGSDLSMGYAYSRHYMGAAYMEERESYHRDGYTRLYNYLQTD